MASNERQFNCPKCQKDFIFTLPINIEIVNEPSFSAAIAPHQEPIVCPNCGQAYCFFLQQIASNWGLKLLDEKERAKLTGSRVIALR